MPKRKAARRVPTPDVQGEDSWVLLRPLTVGEVIELQKEIEARPREGLFHRLVQRFKKSEPRSRSKIYRDFAWRIIDCIADWNWVGDGDNPLPNPRAHPEVVEKLTNVELTALTEIVLSRGETEKAKN